ncbi:MAG: glycoside hydrolase family 140 protein [Chryseolinea sp.]
MKLKDYILKTSTICFTLLLCAAIVRGQKKIDHGPLVVTADKTGLQYADGTPFFWLGDTAWELNNRLDTKEIISYLDNRVAKGFNVIQMTILSTGSFNRGNRNGDVALHDSDPTKPNEKYFARIDTVVRLAQEKGLIMALVISWGDKVVKVPGYGADPVIFDKAKALTYAKYIGNRYKNFNNLIWILGGDVPAINKEGDFKPVFNAMAQGIIETTGHKCLITFHPAGYRSSSEWFQATPWLDFNMIQSSHGGHDAPNWDFVTKDLARTPAKPTLDAEPNYEDHPVHPWPTWSPDSGYFRDYDVRKQSYRSVFAGAFGVTYGHHAVWQFMSEREEVLNYADRGWRNAMERPGASQMKYLKTLIESRDSYGRIHDLSIVASGQGVGKSHIEAFRSNAGDYAMIYLPVGREVSINTASIKARKLNVWWYNPKNGEITKGGILDKSPHLKFIPPTVGMGNDWVLVVEDASKKYKDIGK